MKPRLAYVDQCSNGSDLTSLIDKNKNNNNNNNHTLDNTANLQKHTNRVLFFITICITFSALEIEVPATKK